MNTISYAFCMSSHTVCEHLFYLFQTIKHSTDPVYKERYLFTIESEHLDRRMLQFQVYAVDKYARQKVIGEADIRVGDVDLNMPIKMWLNLRDIAEEVSKYRFW